jgi:hypothetical protein
MTDSLVKSTREPQKITWSEERKKWLCFDDKLIDLITNSKSFIVPEYSYYDLEKKFNKDFSNTKKVISHSPLANEGQAHISTREHMLQDVNRNMKKAISIFKEQFENKIYACDYSSGSIDIAILIIESILVSNLAIANIDLGKNLKYADIFFVLDQSQSVKSRVNREELIKELVLEINDDDPHYKLALATVGVNALISTTLHSFIKILTNFGYENLINSKYFYSNGIKYFEKVCIQDSFFDQTLIKVGDSVRCYVECYENYDLTDSEKNKKFFAAGTNHSCIGMGYSLSIWKELIKILHENFKDVSIISYNYRTNDTIFNFPVKIMVKCSK